MEDVIEKNFCNLCREHKCKECMKMYINQEKGVLTYGCSNYKPTTHHPLKHFDFENYEIKSDKYWEVV